ncbi:two-component sensor histidine kinase [Acrocarpospora phusangensis]|uniref:histidine kinase n=1 Tax=Acrocarpospora phusangensis TaxID=1070424 RepID=A0A919Q8Z4_9ACTN|nr:histidine kinase [Acrocarpospora phusangensis]GIH22390.1 two-component sensor histidine kinase [Acrocarpospora phusangensis]
MLGLIRSLWDEPRPLSPPPRVWRDWALVGVLVPVAVLEGFLRRDLPWPAVSVLLTAGLTVTLLWRRTMPLLMIVIAFGVNGVAHLIVGGNALETHTMVFLLILVHALVRWGAGREVVIGLTIVVAAAVWTMAANFTVWADVIGGSAVLAVSVALGVAFRYRSGARMRELDRVKLLEREQLARDLHDTVAHHVSAMAIRAQAGLATAALRPDAATDALRVIEEEASRALAEMQTMVRALRRDQPADLTPARRIADLNDLARHGRSGPPVEVEISGDVGDLPPSIQAAIYRLAQESVTNARRHARHATRIEVRVTADDTSVRLRVSDDGESSAMRPAASPGYGLIGMIERADLLGGTCVAGPDADRGWTVTAVLPRTAA